MIMTSTNDYQYSNGTIYGIQKDGLRYTWAGYFLFVLASSLVGDTTILIASIKYRAIKLHRVIIVIIQHLAVCDLMVSVTDVLPKLITIIKSKWVLGDFLSYLTPHATYYFNVASICLICTMTSCKLLLLKYPLRFGTASSKKAHIFCVASWSTALVLPIMTLIIDRKDVYFSYRSYQWGFGFSADIWQWLRPTLTLLLVFIPNCLVVATTIWLLVIAKRIARRSREHLKWQGIMTTLLTAIVYCVSFLPTLVYRVGESKVSSSFFHTTFFRIALSFLNLNTISNFYIYSLTVYSFRDFIKSRLQFHSRMTYSISQGKISTFQKLAYFV